MKPAKPFVAVSLAGLLASAVAGLAQAQITPVQPVAVERAGRVIVSDPQAAALGANTTQDRQKLSTEIKSLMNRFERVREAYLKEQEELRRRARGAATERERERIRDQIKSSIESWRERERNLREELKDRIASLRDQMPSRKEIMDNARENVRDAGPARKRRGQD